MNGSERIASVSIVLRVDTDRRRLEYVIDAPDGAPLFETALLIEQALGTLGGAGWYEVPLAEQNVLAIVRLALSKAHRKRSDGEGWALNWLLHDHDVEALVKSIANEIVQQQGRSR